MITYSWCHAFSQLGSTVHHRSCPCQLANGNQSLPASRIQSLLAGFQSYLQLLPRQQHPQDLICPSTKDRRPALWHYPAAYHLHAPRLPCVSTGIKAHYSGRVKGILGENSQHVLPAELQPGMGLCQGNSIIGGSALPDDAEML